MPPHTCPRCKQNFTAPSKLIRHLSRKTVCTLPPEELAKRAHVCRFCERHFAFQQGLSLHIRKHCKVANSKEGLEALADRTEQRQKQEHQAQQIQELQNQLARVTRILEKGMQLTPAGAATAATGTQVATNIQASTIIGVQNNYTLNLFGQESVKHLTPERIRSILASAAHSLPAGSGRRLQEHEKPAPPVQKAVETASRAVLQALITEVYANTSCPENLTAYIPNKKEDQVMIWAKPTEETEPCWQLRPLEQLVPTIQGKVLDALNDNQPWGSNKEKLREYGLLIRGSYDYSPQGFARLIKGVLQGNKTLLAALGISP
jgi:hypothetical protein